MVTPQYKKIRFDFSRVEDRGNYERVAPISYRPFHYVFPRWRYALTARRCCEFGVWASIALESVEPVDESRLERGPTIERAGGIVYDV